MAQAVTIDLVENEAGLEQLEAKKTSASVAVLPK